MIRYKITELLLIFCVLFNFSRADDCSCLDISDDEFKTGYANPEGLLLRYSGEIKRLRMKNTVNIIETENNWNTKYIDAKLENDESIIYTTEAFKNYPREQNSKKIILKITLKCTGTSNNADFKFIQVIKEANEFDPEFSQNEYRFSVPLPLYEGIDLSTFQNISAKDLDVYGNQISFTSIGNSIIEVGTKSQTDPNQRDYFASIKLKKVLFNIEDSIKFTIIATDSGTPPHSSKASVIITANPEFPQLPIFEKVLYEGYLDNDLNLVIDNVILKKSTFSNYVEFSTNYEDDGDLFSIDSNENVIMIGLAKKLTDADIEGRSILRFVLLAKNRKIADPGKAVIVVKVPVKSYTTPNTSPSSNPIPSSAPNTTPNLSPKPTPNPTPNPTQTPTPNPSPNTSPNQTSTPKPIPNSSPNPTPKPHAESPFKKDYCIFQIKSNFSGIIEKFSNQMTGTNSQLKGWIYELEVDDDHIIKSGSEINSSTGELKLKNALPPGIFSFNVIAKNSEVGIKGKTEVNLVVENAENNTDTQCNDKPNSAIALFKLSNFSILIISYCIYLFNLLNFL